MNSETIVLFIIPLVSALIGWLTNLLAVKMIFRPRKPRKILGITIVGLIPKRRSDLAQTIGNTIERELISFRDFRQVLQTPAFHSEMVAAINEKIDETIVKRLGDSPLVSLMMASDSLGVIKKRLTVELEEAIPPLIDKFMGSVEQRLDLKKLVRDKIEDFELSKLETIIYTIAARELKAIELFGGALGFLVGLFQVGILLLSRL